MKIQRKQFLKIEIETLGKNNSQCNLCIYYVEIFCKITAWNFILRTLTISCLNNAAALVAHITKKPFGSAFDFYFWIFL